MVFLVTRIRSQNCNCSSLINYGSSDCNHDNVTRPWKTCNQYSYDSDINDRFAFYSFRRKLFDNQIIGILMAH